MPTIAGRIGPAILKEALAAADGRHTSAKPLVFTDPAERGVSIRVQGKRAGWYLRFNGKFAKLGDVGNPDVKAAAREAAHIYSLKDAVERAGRVREMLKLGMDPTGYLAARSLGQSHEEAASTGTSVAARHNGAWTVHKLGERFVTEHIATNSFTAKGRVRAPSKKTIKEVERLWREPDIAALGHVLLRDLTRRQIETVRNAWYAAGRYDAQRKMITYFKRAMSWARDRHEEAGLGDIAPWWLELKWTPFARKARLAESEGEALPRPLTPEQVAKLLYVAEVNRIVPGRKVRDATSEVTLSALWWVALTAQRTHAAYGVTIGSIEDRTEVEGWYDVSWAPAMMKARRQFALPVPPEVYDRTLGRALQSEDRREPTMWVFPSPTLKDRGKESYTDRPLGDGALNSLLRRLRGKDRPGQPDLLAVAGLPRFTLHELRDSLATYLADTQLPASTASAILDHASDGEEPTSREAAVTREHYNKSQRMPLKFKGLVIWSEAVLAEFDRLMRNHDEAQRVLNLRRQMGERVRRLREAPPASLDERELAKVEMQERLEAEEAFLHKHGVLPEDYGRPSPDEELSYLAETYHPTEVEKQEGKRRLDLGRARDDVDG